MKILSIIPDRGGSKGIPMKNIVKINRKPLLYYSVKSSLDSKYITNTIKFIKSTHIYFNSSWF